VKQMFPFLSLVK